MASPNKEATNRGKRQPASMDLSTLLFAFRRKWFLILFLGTVCSLGSGYAVWKFLPPPKATAFVIYEISTTQPSILARLPDEREFNSFRQSQANLVTKRSVLSRVLDEPGITSIKECRRAKDPIQWLEEVIKVDFKMGREYMRVNVDLESKEDAQTLVSALHKNFLYEAVNKEKEAKVEKFDKLQKIQSASTKSLEERILRDREIGQKAGAANDRIAALQQEYVQQQLSMLKSERLRLSTEILRLKTELSTRRDEASAADNVEPPEYLIQAALDSNQEYRNELATLSDLERRLKEYEKVLAPGVITPTLTSLQEAVAKQKSLLETLPKQLREAAVESARTKHRMQSGASLDALGSKLTLLESTQATIEKEINDLAGKSKDLTSTQQDFEASKMVIVQLQKKTQELSGRVAQMEIEMDAPDRITVFQEPTTEMPNDTSRRIKYSLMVLLGGFLFGAAPFWLLELRRKIFHEESQLVEHVSLPLIGTIPNIPRKRRARAREAVIAQPRMRALVTESIDSTRATVLFKLQESGGRSVMVTSSVAGEAKSSVSGHIAISLARAGFRTLIIDSDMRRPTLHRVFGVEKAPGFSDVLLGRAELSQVVQESKLQNLFVVAASDWIPAASSSLASGAWAELLKDAKEQFDIVVVDSPPVLLVADALTMARDVDSVLVSVLKNVSEIDLINRTILKLESLGVQPMGLIASGLSHRMYKNRYYDRYSSAYSRRRAY